ncbi:hypothetical protein A9P44_16355 [Paenibacillus polymyxa]|nr:hypothetical protein [Paenibacillus polymyxa]OBA05354.1 hypothetical protein A9P44_16355 [Paenibacillus polymyxa]
MTYKKIKRWTKTVLKLLFIVNVTGLVVFIGYLIFDVLTDKKALVSTPAVNSIALILGMLSLPGIVVQLVSLLNINEKKTFSLTSKCPHCRHLVEMKMKED